MTRTLVIVRTHRADVASLAAFDLLAEAGLDADIVFCVDERKGAADMGERPKVAFDHATLARLGLYAHQNCGWRCGDYCYYVTREARPDYDHYWLLEPDVRIHAGRLAEFFAPLARVPADLLAAQYGPRSDLWGWTRTIAASGLPAYGCLYPITRLSGRAIDALLVLRRAWSADGRMATALDWPNDEAFTASALTAGGFVCRDLNADSPRYTAQSFGVMAVVDYDLVLESPPNGLIYHPVRDFGPWLERAEQRIGDSDYGAGPRGRSRADASYLGGVAQACLGHPQMFGAALVPLLLAHDLWTARRWADGQPFGNLAADAHQAELCADKLRRRFGAGAQQAPAAVASLARAGKQAADVPAATDFDCWGEIAIRSYPARFAVPYAFSLATSEVLSTLHVSARDVGAASSPAAVQRRTARAVVRLSFDAVRRLEAQPRPPVGALRVVFGAEHLAAGALSASCQAGGKTLVHMPGPLAQLLADPPSRRAFAALPQRRRAELLQWCVLSFLRLHVHGLPQRPAVICLPLAAGRLAAALLHALQPAETIFVLDQGAPATASDRVQAVVEELAASGHDAACMGTAGLLASLATGRTDAEPAFKAPIGSAA